MKLILSFIFDYLILGIIAFLLKANLELSWNFFQVFLALGLIHFILSFKILHAQRIGGILSFGSFVMVVKPGLIIVPFFSSRLVSESSLVIQKQFPGDPEKIDKAKDDAVDEGKVLPIRITHAEDETSSDPLSKRITTEPTFFVRYQITDFKVFFTTIGDLPEAEKQMRDTGEFKLRVEFAKRTAAKTNEQQAKVNNDLKSDIQKAVKDWGITIKSTGIMLNFNHNLNIAMAGVGEAAYKKQSKILEAEGEKERFILEGIGKSEAEELMIKALASGNEEMAKKLGIQDGEFILKMQMLQKALETSQHTIIPGSEEFKLLSGLKEVFSKS